MSTPTPPPITEATNPQSALPDFASVFQFNNRVSTLEKDVSELKKYDPLKTQVTALVDEHLDARLGATRDEFMNYLLASITAKITPQVIQKMVKESLEEAVLAKESSQPQYSYETAAMLTEFELKKILIDTMDKSQSYLMASEHRECYNGLIKSYELNKSLFSTYEKLDWENPEGGDYPFDLTKPLPIVMSGNHQKVLVDYFFNNDLKYMQGGVLTMTYTTSITKIKAAQYDLPGIVDMVPNIWSHVKVAYDKHALWRILHWREQHKTFYRYARGLESRHDVYSTKHILAVTQVKVMRKHRYGYLKEIVVRRDDIDLYTFTEGDFPRLGINDIEDMLPLFSDGILTRLLTSLDDITKNIHMEYLPKRRWSSLEKKRAHIMIKAINKLLKERRMMRSLEKFIGGRHYGTDLRLLQ
ncbi:hypothetical protein Tco_1139383 [Tanacetum coccineum]